MLRVRCWLGFPCVAENFCFPRPLAGFIRSGRVGGWRDYFTEERMSDWRDWMEAETLGTGLRFTMDPDKIEGRMRRNSIIPI